MANRWNWTQEQEDYLSRLFDSWHSEFVRNGKIRKNTMTCPVEHRHAYKRGYCLLSERQWIIAFFRNKFYTGELSDRSIWTKYGRVNGLRENGKVKRRRSRISDSYESPNGFELSSGFKSNDSIRAWERLLQAAGLEYIGSGISRRVYDLGDGNVLKVQTAHYGKANPNEINLWKEVEGTQYEKFFAPIIAADEKDSRWLVMAKAKTYNNDTQAGDNLVRKLRKVIQHFNLYDVHFGNVGTYNGRPVLIDYAA